jgi:hypothetical protein
MGTTHCKIGDMESVLGLSDEIVKGGLEPSIAVFDSIITCVCRMGRLKEAEFTPND